MYFDIIVNKFIPGVYVLLNNETKQGYSHVFNDLLKTISIYEKDKINKLNWKTYTTYFERAIMKAFNNNF